MHRLLSIMMISFCIACGANPEANNSAAGGAADVLRDPSGSVRQLRYGAGVVIDARGTNGRIRFVGGGPTQIDVEGVAAARAGVTLYGPMTTNAPVAAIGVALADTPHKIRIAQNLVPGLYELGLTINPLVVSELSLALRCVGTHCGLACNREGDVCPAGATCEQSQCVADGMASPACIYSQSCGTLGVCVSEQCQARTADDAPCIASQETCEADSVCMGVAVYSEEQRCTHIAYSPNDLFRSNGARRWLRSTIASGAASAPRLQRDNGLCALAWFDATIPIAASYNCDDIFANTPLRIIGRWRQNALEIESLDYYQQ